MKLTYRGQSYEMFDSNQRRSGSADQSKIKLIYRGHTYYTTPRPAESSQATTNGATVTLTYRGVTYQRTLQAPKPYQQSRAINWRYQIDR